MPDEVTFCPHCGKQQLKLNTRFCHICGQPIPAAPALVPVAPAPVAPAPKEPRRPSAWWLLPLFLVGVVALVLLAWEPARSRVGDLLAGIRTDATEIAPPALARAVPGDATVGPTQIVSVTPTATPAASATGAIPPNATALSTATLRPTATPSPTATLPPSATPTAAPPATSERFVAVSLQGVVNAM
ncbi:MAG: zinc ribbon domain-containing protein, partial [Anaerolineae bacterium]